MKSAVLSSTTASAKWGRALGSDRFGSARLKPWQIYLSAAAVTALTFWVRFAISGPLGGRPALVMFTVPIMLSAYVGGLRGGLLATALSGLGTSYFLLPPIHSFAIASAIERWLEFFLILAGVVVSIVNEALHRARDRADIVAGKHRQAESAARASEERLQMVTDNARVGLAMLNRERRFTFANAAYADILGLPSSDLVGQRVADVLPLLYEEQIRPHLDAAFDGERVTYELHRPASDDILYCTVKYEPTIVDDFVSLVVEVITDITERKRSEFRIERLNRVYSVLSGINALIVRARDREELFREACRISIEKGKFPLAWIGVTDGTQVSVPLAAWAGNAEQYRKEIQATLRQQLPPPGVMVTVITEAKAMVVNDIATYPRFSLRDETLAGGFRSLVVLPLCVSGKVCALFTLCAEQAGVFDEDEMVLLTELANDISFALDHIEKAEKLNYLAYYDALTGLANRSLFLERVALHMRSAASDGQKIAMFLIDLERFKNINDSFGQLTGDDLLKQVAKWLERNVGDVSLLARVEADHFAVVLPDLATDGDAERCIESTMAALLEQPFRLNDAVFRIAAKAGVVLFPADGDNADALFKRAETALKQAKARGDRYLFYTQAMTDRVAGKPTLESQLRQALDNEEFLLHYQPKVHLVSGKLSGAEALIRWNDPRTGLVPPDMFIPVLEETGLIHEVGHWAMRKAIEDYLRWRDQGLPAPRIAVNVSPLQLRNRGFIAEISQAVGIDARSAAGLELEITESMIMEDIKQSVASLKTIRALGVSVAIDDFGTGFSSLGYLLKLPVDTLKIDRSFVNEMTDAQEELSLVSTIINLAHSLKLKVVAEGVETNEQSRLLRLLGCDEIQGYLVSKPVPRAIFEEKFLTRIANAT